MNELELNQMLSRAICSTLNETDYIDFDFELTKLLIETELEIIKLKELTNV